MAYYGSNYPPNSGPPPPPMGGYPGAYGGGYGGYPSGPAYGGGYGGGNPGYSAYNVNQYPGYGQQQQGPSPYGQYSYSRPSGGYSAPPPGAVPGFTVPGYSGPPAGAGHHAPPQQPPPPSMHYSHMQNMMSDMSMQQVQWANYKKMGLLGDEEEDEEYEAYMAKLARKRQRKNRKKLFKEEDEEQEAEDDEEKQLMEEEKQKMEERARRAEEKARELQEKLANNDALKEELREKFIDELMRRQVVSGTFEETHGTVYPMMKYEEDDPVAVWYNKERGENIVGEAWDASIDSEYLRKAMRGFGTDEQAIIDVISTRSRDQRNRCMLEYKTCFGRDLIHDLEKELSGNYRECVLACFESAARYDAWCLKNNIYDLIKDLKSELSGDFRSSILACFETLARYDAYEVKHAIYGAGTDENCLIEILLTRTNEQIKEMASEYDKITYGKQKDPTSSLEKDIIDDTSGDFKRLLISASQGNRRLIDRSKLEESVEEVTHDGVWSGMFRVNYNKLCDVERCKRMAGELFKAGEKKLGTDEEVFNRIFSSQDYYTLRVVWDEYVKVSQRDILNSVDRETSGDFKRGLRAIAQNIKCRPMFFAERLYKSMKGLGTDDSTLIRIVMSRSEIDLVQIKACFLEQYKQTLWNFIKDDTSGDYRRLLLAIVGKN